MVILDHHVGTKKQKLTEAIDFVAFPIIHTTLEFFESLKLILVLDNDADSGQNIYDTFFTFEQVLFALFIIIAFTMQLLRRQPV